SDLEDFPVPQGMTEVYIDPASQQLATPACPTTRKEVFITGTEPTEFCELHGGRMLTQTPPGSWLSRIFGAGGAAKPPAPNPVSDSAATVSPSKPAPAQTAAKASEPDANAPVPSAEDEKKKGLL